MASLKETALNFGPSSALVGILTHAAPVDDAPEGVAMVILNSGIIHRVGPNRMHVKLARTLAARGVPSLRIDLPGIGDSRPIGMGGSVLEEALAAIKTALDLLERRGVADRFVVFGLCSGADHAFATAYMDPRVVGLAMVDPTRIFPTWKTWAIRVLQWAARPGGWLRLLRGRYGIWRHIRQRLRPSTVGEDDSGEATTTGARPQQGSDELKAQAGEALKTLVGRGVRICYIITGDQRHQYNYHRQFLDAFPEIGLEDITEIEMLPGAHHTLPRETDRSRLEELLGDWVTSCEPARLDQG